MHTSRLPLPLLLVGMLAGTIPPVEHSAECAFYKAYYLEHQLHDLTTARALYQESVADPARHVRVAEARAALARIDAALGQSPGGPATAPAARLEFVLDPRAENWETDGTRARACIERLESTGDVLGALRARTRYTYAVFAQQFRQQAANLATNLTDLRARLATEQEAGNTARAGAVALDIERRSRDAANQRSLANCSLPVRAQEYAGKTMGAGRSLAGFCFDAANPDPRWSDWCADLRTYLTISMKRADLVVGQRETLERLREQVSELERLVQAKEHQQAQGLADALWHFAID